MAQPVIKCPYCGLKSSVDPVGRCKLCRKPLGTAPEPPAGPTTAPAEEEYPVFPPESERDKPLFNSLIRGLAIVCLSFMAIIFLVSPWLIPVSFLFLATITYIYNPKTSKWVIDAWAVLFLLIAVLTIYYNVLISHDPAGERVRSIMGATIPLSAAYYHLAGRYKERKRK